MGNDMYIKVIPGKKGSSTEGKVFIAVDETAESLHEVLKERGGFCSGVKNGKMLWNLPGHDIKSAEDLVSSVIEIMSRSSSKPEDISETDEPQPQASDRHGESIWDNGYVPGMSIAECDSCRTPVIPGEVSKGDELVVDGIKRRIFALSPKLVLAEDIFETMKERFPNTDLKPGMVYQFAMWRFEGRKS